MPQCLAEQTCSVIIIIIRTLLLFIIKACRRLSTGVETELSQGMIWDRTQY